MPNRVCIVAGALMRPLAPPRPRKDDEELTPALTPAPAPAATPEKLSAWQTVNKYLDLSLFKHRGFLIYLSGNVIMFLGFFAPIVFLAAYAKDMGVDEYSAAFLLSILAFVDMFARPSMGLLANSRWIRPRIQYFFCAAVLYNGVCHVLCPLVQDYTGLVVYAIFFGFAFGMVSSVLFETLMDLRRGPHHHRKLVDVTKSYKYMYFCCGAVVIVASIWLFIGNFINYRLLERERKQADTYKEAETGDPDEPDRVLNKKEASPEPAVKGESDGEAMQRETNI
ncbi:hypothetical protein CRUP_019050 [Coryphaenoides rupestris]|nr:hypothetical protein CRUP_019050 [Coryphaenoides rupestris]